MEEKVNLALVGIFVVVLGTALAIGVLWFSSGKSYGTAFDSYHTYMKESVTGLNLNAPVRYLGVDVGRVSKIALAPGNVEQVELTLDIERGTPVKVDTVAVLETQGLIGLAFVNLTAGGRDSPRLQKQPGEERPVIKAGPSRLTRLDSAVTALLTNLNKTSENINALLDEDNRRVFKQTLADLETLSNTLAARSMQIDSGLADAARIMKNAAELTEELKQLAQADAGAGGVQQLVTQLRDLTSSLQRVSGQLEQDPSVLLYGKSAAKRGPGE